MRILTVLISLLVVIPALANPAAAGAVQQAGADVAATIKAGRASLDAGRIDEADAAANRVLSEFPANREAADLKVAVLLRKQQYEEALAAYDNYARLARHADVALLAPIAKAELTRLCQAQMSDDGALAAAAYERLARAGDAEATRVLKGLAARLASASPDRLAPVVSLARLGDGDAARTLAAGLRSAAAEAKRQIIKLLKEAQARSEAPALIPLLSDSDPGVRAAAAAALGALDCVAALPALRPLLHDPAPIVRPFAVVSMKRLGDTSVDSQVAAMLRSDIPDVRLIAAEAYQQSKSTQWVQWIKPLLDERNDVTRLRAAEALVAGDPGTARLALLGALQSENFMVRNEASRIVDEKKLADAALARRLLSDASPWVRVRAAGIVLTLSSARAQATDPDHAAARR